MSDDTSDTSDEPSVSTRVYSYGVGTRVRDASGKAHRWVEPDVLVEQVRLAHHLRNALVEREQNHAVAVGELWATHPDVSVLTDAVTAGETIVFDLVEQTRKAKVAARNGKVPTELARALRDAKANVKQAKADLRAAKAIALDELGEEFAALAALKRDTKPLYADPWTRVGDVRCCRRSPQGVLATHRRQATRRATG
jgi:hypothetical protein